MAQQTPPPYANIAGIARADMKINEQETIAEYDGNARPGELVVDLTTYNLFIGNADGNLNGFSGGGGTNYANANLVAYLNSGIAGNILPSANNVYNLGSPTRQWASMYVSANTLFIGNVPVSMVSNSLVVNGDTVVTANIPVTGNVAATNILTDNYLFANGTPVSFGGTNYSNTNAAAYLASNTDATIIAINTAAAATNSNVANTNSNVATLTTSVINTNSNVANTNSNVANTNSNVANLSTSITSTNSNVANTDSNVANVSVAVTSLSGNVYNNSNVAAFLLTATGNISANFFAGNGSLLTGITSTASLAGNLAGNINANTFSINNLPSLSATGNITGAFFIGDGSQLTNLPAGNYSNANVEAYLPTYTGTFNSVNFVISATGSADYVFSGPGIVAGNTNDPVLYLYKGFSYTFNNTTGASHPFAIRVSAGGAAYTLGVTGSQTGVQTFTVPMNAPSTLYYQCTIHGNMGNVINIDNFPGTYGNTQVEAYLPISNTIININSNVANAVSNTANTNSNVANTNSNVSNLSTSITNTNSNVANTNSNVANTNSNVATLSTAVTSLTGNVYNNSNVAAFLLTATGNVSANFFVGNGSLLTGVTSTANTGNITFDQSTIESNQSNAYINLNAAGSGVLSLGTNDESNVRIVTDEGNVNNQWTFDSTGNLTLPSDGYLRVTAGITSTGASPAPTLSGFSSVSAINISSSGNVQANVISATGNITGAFFIGDGSQLTGITASATLAGNLSGNLLANTFSINNLPQLSVAGNITANLFIGNGAGLTNVSATLGTVTAAGNTLFAAGGPPKGFLNLDTGTGLLVLGQRNANNIHITANSTGTALTWAFDATGNLTLPGNVWAVNYANNTPVSFPGTYGNTEVAAYLPTYTGNIAAGNISATYTVAGGNVSATVLVTGEYVRTMPTTVGFLVAPGTSGITGAGTRSFVTDADSNVFGAVASGGGGNAVPVYTDGTNWYIG